MQRREEFIGKPRVSGLRVGIRSGIGSLNPPPSLPIVVLPGDKIGLSDAEFSYVGPKRDLYLGWAIKPAGALDWNGGASLFAASYNLIPLSVDDCPNAVLHVPSWLSPVAVVTIPAPGTYSNKGNSYSGRLPTTSTLHSGTFDTWVWITDVTGIQLDGLPVTIDAVTWDKYVLKIDTDADVGKIEANIAVSNLNARYMKS